MAKGRVRKWLGILIIVLLVVTAVLGVYVALEMPGHTTPPEGSVESALAEIRTRAPAAEPGSPLEEELLASIQKGLAFLKAHQEGDGHFVTGRLAPKPAFTALAVSAFRNSPHRYRVDEHPFLKKAVQAILASQKDNGSIHADIPGMSFSNYSTGLALVALQEIGDPALRPTVDKAAAYLKLGTHKGGEGDPHAGGAGYNPGARPDLNNTMTVAEALHKSGIPEDDPVFKEIEAFVTNTQNRPESNPQAWASSDPDHQGGHVYRPGESPAGSWTDREGQKHYASYGTMTYAGLVTFLYAYVDKDDPRVQSAWDWICRNYDLHENVNMKDVGLYYYYRIMAKALHAYGERYVTEPSGVKHDWARDMAKHLTDLQETNGSWVNANTKYLEGDQVLVTAYALQALSICYDELQRQRANSDTPDDAAAAGLGR